MPPGLEQVVGRDQRHISGLVARGTQLLQVLSTEAKAARAEANLAQLQSALEDARAGDEGPLQRWMEQHHPGLTGESASTWQHDPLGHSHFRVDSAAPFCLPGGEGDVPSSWEELASYARQRLSQIPKHRFTESPFESIDLAASDTALWNPVYTPTPPTSDSQSPPDEKSPFDEQANLDDQATHHKQPIHNRLASSGELATPDVLASDRSVSEHATASMPTVDNAATSAVEGPGVYQAESIESLQSEPTVVHSPHCEDPTVAQVTYAALEADGPKPEMNEGRRGNRYKAATTSLALHVALVIVLASLGMQLPKTTASLALLGSAPEAADTTFELNEPIEVTSEVDSVPEEPAFEPTTDVSDSIARELDLPTSLPSLSGETSVATSLAGSTAAAMAAATSYRGESKGSGVPKVSGGNFFGASSSGNSFCYVIDASESMRGGAWESAKAELLRSLRSLKPSQRFYIIFFNQVTAAIPMPGEREPARTPLYATAAHLQHAQNWIESIQLARGAPPNEALELAISREPEAIYLLTDGVTKVDVASFLRKANRVEDLILGQQVRVPIHAIAYHSLSGESLMRTVAHENKGQFIYVPKPIRK